MTLKIKKSLISRFSDKLLYISAIGLAIYGTFMIISAEMGETTGDIQIITKSSIKQFVYLGLAIVILFVFSILGRYIVNLKMKYVWIIYCVGLVALISTRFFGSVGGAYAWIRFGNASIQPSEFAKSLMIFLACRLFAKSDNHNLDNFIKYLVALIVYVVIIIFVEKDFGSGIVLLIIGYACCLIPNYKETRKYQLVMMFLILAALAGACYLLSDAGLNLLSKIFDGYMLNRFLAAANPFAYVYDAGYHLVMSLVCISTGGLFGLGYGKSIHKFMNFPNPSTDFIVPVIIEENGLIFGFLPIVLGYGIILYKLSKYSLKIDKTTHKIILLGTFMYFMCHFVLNIGGVSGLIPLTGVPLLLISYGGSSLWSCMIILGFSQSLIIDFNKEKKCA